MDNVGCFANRIKIGVKLLSALLSPISVKPGFGGMVRDEAEQMWNI